MDRVKSVKLSELTMSRYLPGQSFLNKTVLTLQPQIDGAQYFFFSSELESSSPQASKFINHEIFLVSEYKNKQIASITEDHLTVTKLTFEDIRPLGMTVFADKIVLAVVDDGLEGQPSLKYFSRGEENNLKLVGCLVKTDDGNLKNCLSNDERIKFPRDVCPDWKPQDVAVKHDGNLIISDISPKCGHRLSLYSPEGKIVTTFGRALGPGESSFKKPTHLAVDCFGRILASDCENGNVQIFDGRGMWLNSFGESSSSAPQSKSKSKALWGHDERLERPGGISCDGLGNVIVCDAGQSRVAMFSSSGQFVENIQLEKKKTKDTPVAVKVNQSRMAVSFKNTKKNVFKKFLLREMAAPCE